MNNTTQIGVIQAIKTSFGFICYGRMGALIRTDENKQVVYSNIYESCTEYQRMIKKIAKA